MTIDELLVGVNIALDAQPLVCPAFDAPETCGDGRRADCRREQCAEWLRDGAQPPAFSSITTPATGAASTSCPSSPGRPPRRWSSTRASRRAWAATSMRSRSTSPTAAARICVFVATEQNQVSAFSAADGSSSGRRRWRRRCRVPVPPVRQHQSARHHRHAGHRSAVAHAVPRCHDRSTGARRRTT